MCAQRAQRAHAKHTQAARAHHAGLRVLSVCSSRSSLCETGFALRAIYSLSSPRVLCVSEERNKPRPLYTSHPQENNLVSLALLRSLSAASALYHQDLCSRQHSERADHAHMRCLYIAGTGHTARLYGGLFVSESSVVCMRQGK